MNRPRNKVKSVFDRALDIDSPDERDRFVKHECSDDPEVLAKVAALLSAYAEAGNFLESQPVEISPTLELPVAEQPGTQIGPYKLLQQVGEGGMGVVYMAEQTKPVKRRVALKIIKPGMDSRQVIARFEAERQALALMDHPHIAKVLDAATTEAGRPYFVMELVKGVPITQYCDEQHLSPRERLSLFIPVCQAVQHAHQKGIVHRDLKPSNVLVALYDGQPVPKVIDFGIAKATNQQLTEKTMFTQLGQVVGTLEYMSPEQAQVNQLDVDTRSDIYSLGVLLYELLIGATPFDRDRLRSAALDEMMRIIREEEPPRPSLRLSTIDTLPSVAANRRTEPQKLRTLVRGELDWIVMKALEKDRARRYETANGFAVDVQRYLDDEAVLACPPSAGYRFRKFARRNKALLATATTVAAALLFGLIGTTSQWRRAETARAGEAEQRQLAVQHRDRAQQESEKNRRSLYASDMIAAQQAWESANVTRVLEMLERHKPQPGQDDLRGFQWGYLWNLCQRGLRTPQLEQHNSEVWCIAYSPDGKWIVTGSEDGEVKLHDAATRRRLDSVSTGTLVANASFSADGQLLATAHPHDAVIVWQVTDTKLVEKERVEETADQGRVRGAATFSPQGRKLVWGNEIVTKDNEGKTQRSFHVAMVDFDSRQQPVLTDEGHRDRIYCLAFTTDGTLVSASADTDIKLWNTKTLKLKKTLSDHRSAVRNVASSPDNRLLASASWDGTLKVWNLETGECIKTFENLSSMFGVAFSHDTETLATAGVEGRVKLWNVQTWDEEDSLIGHEQSVFSLAFSPVGTNLASGGSDGKIKLWDLSDRQTPQVLTRHQLPVRQLALAPNGVMLASAAMNEMKLSKIDEPEKGRTLKGPFASAAFCDNGRVLASGGMDGAIIFSDVATGKELQRRTQYYSQAVFALASSSDGRLLASGSGGKGRILDLWDVSTRTPTGIVNAVKYNYIWSVAFSPNGNLLAAGSGDRKVMLFDVRTKQPYAEVPEIIAKEQVNSVLFLDDHVIAFGCEDGTIRLWDIKQKKQLGYTLTGHARAVRSLAFSPDARILASASLDATIRLWYWDTETWTLDRTKVSETLVAHAGGVNSLVFASNGRLLISTGGDKTVRLWHAATEEEAGQVAP